MLRPALLLLALLAVGCHGDGAQSPTTPTPERFTLYGAVTDSRTGAGIPGAVVLVTDGVNVYKNATTHSNGDYTLINLLPAAFTVRVTATRYVPTTQAVTMTADTALSVRLQHDAPKTTFEHGTYLVGIDILPGRYFSTPDRDCYWERLSGPSGGIIASQHLDYDAEQAIADIRPSDAAFLASWQCRTWARSAPFGAQSTIKPGMWLVGAQITPGTYRTTAGYGCRWSRLRDFSDDVSAIIREEFVEFPGMKVAVIQKTDVGFSSSFACGTWTRGW